MNRCLFIVRKQTVCLQHIVDDRTEEPQRGIFAKPSKNMKYKKKKKKKKKKIQK